MLTTGLRKVFVSIHSLVDAPSRIGGDSIQQFGTAARLFNARDIPSIAGYFGVTDFLIFSRRRPSN